MAIGIPLTDQDGSVKLLVVFKTRPFTRDNDMKKLLLAGLLITFAGIGIAKEKPATIVNPPRPTRKYKRLLFVRHYEVDSGHAHSHFFYTDGKWSVVESNDSKWLWLKFGKTVEEYVYFYDKQLEKVGPFCYPGLAALNILETAGLRAAEFLQTKGPKPLGNEGKIFCREEKVKSSVFDFSAKQVNYPKPAKAKVVFTK